MTYAGNKKEGSVARAQGEPQREKMEVKARNSLYVWLKKLTLHMSYDYAFENTCNPLAEEFLFEKSMRANPLVNWDSAQSRFK